MRSLKLGYFQTIDKKDQNGNIVRMKKHVFCLLLFDQKIIKNIF